MIEGLNKFLDDLNEGDGNTYIQDEDNGEQFRCRYPNFFVEFQFSVYRSLPNQVPEEDYHE